MSTSGRKYGRKKSIDWITLSIYMSLLAIGWMMLYAVSYNPENIYSFLDFGTIIGKQSMWVVVSLVVMIASLTIDWKVWNTFAYPIYLISMVSLILVLLIGSEIKGAKSWFTFSGVGLQPSEFAKFATAIAISSYLSYYKSNVKSIKGFLITSCLALAPMVLIIIQPDPGSALTFSFFLFLLYRRGMSAVYFILGFSLIAIFILSMLYGSMLISIDAILIGLLILIFNLPNQNIRNSLLFVVGIFLMTFLLYRINPYYGLGLSTASFILYLFFHIRARTFRMATLVGGGVLISVIFGMGSTLVVEGLLKPHQQARIYSWLRPDLVDSDRLYNLEQSKMAIGSGGFQGKGFLNGTMTKLNYVPEQTTDFIFSTVGEEQGFVGVLGVILLFTLLLIRITVIGERAKSPFIQNYAYCIAGIFFIHVFINIGMSMGLMPVIGIPLPFLSKGGSALIGFTLMIGVLLKMDLEK